MRARGRTWRRVLLVVAMLAFAGMVGYGGFLQRVRVTEQAPGRVLTSSLGGTALVAKAIAHTISTDASKPVAPAPPGAPPGCPT